MKYTIDPNSLPLTEIETQILIALMSEFGFDEKFIQYIKAKGVVLDIFKPIRVQMEEQAYA
jgi:hypothetical protein